MTRRRDATFVAVTVALTLCALLAITHQARRFAHVQDAKRAEAAVAATAAAVVAQYTATATPVPTASPTTTEPPRPTPTAQWLSVIGPFAVGQTLTRGWTVVALSFGDQGFVVTVSGKPGRTSFEIGCFESPHTSPFDLAPVHIFFSRDLAYPDVQTVGVAIREHVRKTIAGHDVCATLAEWRASAHP